MMMPVTPRTIDLISLRTYSGVYRINVVAPAGQALPQSLPRRQGSELFPEGWKLQARFLPAGLAARTGIFAASLHLCPTPFLSA